MPPADLAMSSLVVTADSASATAARRAPWLAIAMVGLAFLIAEQRPSASRLDDFAVDTDQMAVESEGGSPTRRLGFSLIALLGAVGLMRPPRYPLEMRSALAVLGVFYIGWSLASLAWSEDPASTARRLVVVVFCFLGVLGLCRQLSVRDVAVLALALNAFYILLGLGAELALGSFRPWSGSYRFAGMAHPNSQGALLRGALHRGGSRFSGATPVGRGSWPRRSLPAWSCWSSRNRERR